VVDIADILAETLWCNGARPDFRWMRGLMTSQTQNGDYVSRVTTDVRGRRSLTCTEVGLLLLYVRIYILGKIVLTK